MSTVDLGAERYTGHGEPIVLELDNRRGSFGMALFITSEAMLFVILFGVYYYLGPGNQRWMLEEPPKLHYSIPMLAILWSSSGIFYWGEERLKKQDYRTARLALIATIVFGLGFLAVSYFEYSEELLHLTPRTDAYGSIFFAITSLHLLHLIIGLTMLTWLLFLAKRWEPARSIPHQPYHNVGMYWHFVDIMWGFIVAILYVYPNIVHVYPSVGH
ncbi:MAG TPA: cytochrome c oxidase subunit 3 [Terriglobia bacterium]|nr:cytochrome c oxidase subunit 3 [Terriglobia bacterium]